MHVIFGSPAIIVYVVLMCIQVYKVIKYSAETYKFLFVARVGAR